MTLLHSAALLCILSIAAAQGFISNRNIALQGRATQSTIYSGITAAINAIDGNLNSNFNHGSCSCTNGQVSPWWRVDLLRPYKVSHIIVTNRGDCCGERLIGAKILVGNSMENDGNNNPTCAEIMSITNGETKTFQCNNMVGQYVNIIVPGKNTYLQLCEVQVYGEPESTDHQLISDIRGMTLLHSAALLCILSIAAAQGLISNRNIALQGRATQSTIYSGTTAAINAIDGNLNSNFNHGSCSCTNGQVSPWWRVDLLRPYKVSHIIVTNRGDCCGERLIGAKILVGNSMENDGNNNPTCAEITSITNGETKTFQCNNMVGQYVNIIVPGKNTYLQLCEVQVYGEPESTDHHLQCPFFYQFTMSVLLSVYNARSSISLQCPFFYQFTMPVLLSVYNARSSISLQCPFFYQFTMPVLLSVYNARSSISLQCPFFYQFTMPVLLSVYNARSSISLQCPFFYQFTMPVLLSVYNARSSISLQCPFFYQFTMPVLLLGYSADTAVQNVALRGRATQSTNYEGLSAAINAIDGNTDPIFAHGSCFSTKDFETSPWWRVDLLETYQISHITITNRGDCCADYINGAEILIGDSLTNNGNNNPRNMRQSTGKKDFWSVCSGVFVDCDDGAPMLIALQDSATNTPDKTDDQMVIGPFWIILGG
ncbi:uncharacterized protein LOC130360477 [Hyla sarda]|uniref:uncharacterized protein LOC130360477 n=1 Tax=Hyla sarda TaxID=327740 RepID=UPI0024C2ACF4|nr:uncharacterized protein LOC130360477 [Hyla sarda]